MCESDNAAHRRKPRPPGISSSLASFLLTGPVLSTSEASVFSRRGVWIRQSKKRRPHARKRLCRGPFCGRPPCNRAGQHSVLANACGHAARRHPRLSRPAAPPPGLFYPDPPRTTPLPVPDGKAASGPRLPPEPLPIGTSTPLRRSPSFSTRRIRFFPGRGYEYSQTWKGERPEGGSRGDA